MGSTPISKNINQYKRKYYKYNTIKVIIQYVYSGKTGYKYKIIKIIYITYTQVRQAR